MDDGCYQIGVHYYSSKGWGATDATIDIYLDGELLTSEERQLENTDNFWDVGRVVCGVDMPFILVDELSETHKLTSSNDLGF